MMNKALITSILGVSTLLASNTGLTSESRFYGRLGFGISQVDSDKLDANEALFKNAQRSIRS